MRGRAQSPSDAEDEASPLTAPLLLDEYDQRPSGATYDGNAGSGSSRRPGQARHATPPMLASSPMRQNSADVKPGMNKRSASKGHFLRETRPRRKLTWLVLDEAGDKDIVHADKRALIQRFDLGVPMRDMRLLDNTLVAASEGGKILVRDNAIVFSMEHVKLIIMANVALVPREGFESNPAHARFVEKLHDAILEANKEATLARLTAQPDGSEDLEDKHHVEVLPFELVALEVALGEVCTSCTQATKELEALTVPALDALLKRVSKTGLELVRKLKARQQRLTIRVGAVRDELERFLDDDSDLQKFCLTRKKQVEEMVKVERQRSIYQGGEGPVMAVGSQSRRGPSSLGGGMRSLMYSQPGAGGGSPPGMWSQDALLRHTASMTSQMQAYGSSPQPGGPGQLGGMFADDADAEAVEAVENLLESYYMYIDNSYDKLISLDEYIKDTEEFIDIDLDWNRNRLIKLEIMLTAATFAIAPFNLVAGILGENVVIPHFMAREDKGSKPFWVINFVAGVFCFAFFFSILGYIRLKKLL